MELDSLALPFYLSIWHPFHFTFWWAQFSLCCMSCSCCVTSVVTSNKEVGLFVVVVVVEAMNKVFFGFYPSV